MMYVEFWKVEAELHKDVSKSGRAFIQMTTFLTNFKKKSTG